MRKYLLFFAAFLISNYCWAQFTFSGKKVNSDYLNKDYQDSSKYFYGQMDSEGYQEKIKEISAQLNTVIPIGKSIVINYEQAASNCTIQNLKKGKKKYFNKEKLRVSNIISQENNAVDFFVYNQNSFLFDINKNEPKFQQDSGFFSKNIFTLSNNCEALFVLKPNGKFMLAYGNDNFTFVDNFLKEN